MAATNNTTSDKLVISNKNSAKEKNQIENNRNQLLRKRNLISNASNQDTTN